MRTRTALFPSVPSTWHTAGTNRCSINIYSMDDQRVKATEGPVSTGVFIQRQEQMDVSTLTCACVHTHMRCVRGERNRQHLNLRLQVVYQVTNYEPAQGYWDTAAHLSFAKNTQSNLPKIEPFKILEDRSVSDLKGHPTALKAPPSRCLQGSQSISLL